MRNFELMEKPDLFQWIKMTSDRETDGLLERCTVENLNDKLQGIREFKKMKVVGVDVYDQGEYSPAVDTDDSDAPCDFFTVGDALDRPVSDMPDFLRVRIEAVIGGGHVANIKVFLPYVWNKRYIALTGGGTSAEFPFAWAINPTSISMTEVYAVRNHFAAAMTDASVDSFGLWGFKTGTDEWDLDQIIYWSHQGNHVMTVIAKEICKIAYGELPEYAYIV